MASFLLDGSNKLDPDSPDASACDRRESRTTEKRRSDVSNSDDLIANADREETGYGIPRSTGGSSSVGMDSFAIGMDFDVRADPQMDDSTVFTSLTKAGQQSFSTVFGGKMIKKPIATADKSQDDKIIERVRSRYNIPAEIDFPEGILDELRPFFLEETDSQVQFAGSRDKERAWEAIRNAGGNVEARLLSLKRSRITRQIKILKEQSYKFSKVFDELETLGKLHSSDNPIPWGDIHQHMMTTTNCDSIVSTANEGKDLDAGAARKSKSERGRKMVLRLVPLLRSLPMGEEDMEKYGLLWLLNCLRPRLAYLQTADEVVDFLKSEMDDLSHINWETLAQARLRQKLVNQNDDLRTKAGSAMVMANGNGMEGSSDRHEIPVPRATSMASFNITGNSVNSMNEMNTMAQLPKSDDNQMKTTGVGLGTIGEITSFEARKGRSVVEFLLDKIDEVRQADDPIVRYNSLKAGLELRQGAKYSYALTCLLGVLEKESRRIKLTKTSNLILFLWDMQLQGAADSVIEERRNKNPTDEKDEFHDPSGGPIVISERLCALMDPLVQKRLSVTDYISAGRRFVLLLQSEGLNTKRFSTFLDGLASLKINFPKELALFGLRMVVLQGFREWDPAIRMGGDMVQQIRTAFLVGFPSSSSLLIPLLQIHDWETRKAQPNVNSTSSDAELSSEGSEGDLLWNHAKAEKKKKKKTNPSVVPVSIDSNADVTKKRSAPNDDESDRDLKRRREVIVKSMNPNMSEGEKQRVAMFLGKMNFDYGMANSEYEFRGSANWMLSAHSNNYNAVTSNPFSRSVENVPLMPDQRAVTDGLLEAPFAGPTTVSNVSEKMKPNAQDNSNVQLNAAFDNMKEQIFGDPLVKDRKTRQSLSDLCWAGNYILPALERLWVASNDKNTKKAGAKTASPSKVLPLTFLQLKAVCLCAECFMTLASVDLDSKSYRPPASYSAAWISLKQVGQSIEKICRNQSILDGVKEEYIDMVKWVESICAQIFSYVCPAKQDELESCENYINSPETTIAQCRVRFDLLVQRMGHLKPLQPEMFQSLESQIMQKQARIAYDAMTVAGNDDYVRSP